MTEFRRFECDKCGRRIKENEDILAVSLSNKTPFLKVNSDYFHWCGDSLPLNTVKSYDLCPGCASGVEKALTKKKGLLG